MKITNIKKFIKSIVLIFIIIFGISLILTNTTLSHGETKYLELSVSEGDTLWTIAQNEQETNQYFENTDVRDIVYKIKKSNNLKTSNLEIGQKLLIPTV